MVGDVARILSDVRQTWPGIDGPESARSWRCPPKLGRLGPDCRRAREMSDEFVLPLANIGPESVSFGQSRPNSDQIRPGRSVRLSPNLARHRPNIVDFVQVRTTSCRGATNVERVRQTCTGLGRTSASLVEFGPAQAKLGWATSAEFGPEFGQIGRFRRNLAQVGPNLDGKVNGQTRRLDSLRRPQICSTSPKRQVLVPRSIVGVDLPWPTALDKCWTNGPPEICLARLEDTCPKLAQKGQKGQRGSTCRAAVVTRGALIEGLGTLLRPFFDLSPRAQVV